jgi:hypothetical protein
MKIRKGFVSNSSSSSYICDVCGHDESGWDLGLEEADMYECEEGHVFCTSHAVGGEIEDNECYNIPKKHCPICMLDVITNHDLVHFLLAKTGKTREELEKELKENFETGGDLYNENKMKVYQRKIKLNNLDD